MIPVKIQAKIWELEDHKRERDMWLNSILIPLSAEERQKVLDIFNPVIEKLEKEIKEMKEGNHG